MLFILSSKAKNAYFIFFLLYTILSDRFLALNNIIHIITLRHINDDVA